MSDTSYTLVLVGGTGQRFGLGLGYLNLLGVAQMPDRVVVVDAEGAGIVTDVTATAKRLLSFGQASVRYQHLRPYPGKAMAERDLTLAHCVDVGGSELFPLCYSEDEARLPISEGFYATPKLAATAFEELLSDRKSLFSDEFQDGAAVADARRNVIVVGSVAGGTGAGILRSLAAAFRRGNNRVLGIVFGRYFDLPGGQPPTTEDLDRNARVGCDFLLHRDKASPFHVLAMVGPPPDAALPGPVESNTALPHRFPGLLAALSLVTDGGSDLVVRYEQARTNHPKDAQPLRLDLAFGACSQGPQLRDTDVWFPVVEASGARGFLSLADALAAAVQARQELARWREFRFESACAPASLFVAHKLGARIYEALRGWSATGRIHPADATQLWEKLAGKTGARGAIGEAQDGLASFESWIASTAETKALSCRSSSSSELTPHDWRAALDRGTGSLPKEQIDALAQLWCIAVARAQWKSRPQRTFATDGGRWLFRYATTTCTAKPGELVPLATSIEITEVESRAYATPFGQAHAFAKRLELRDEACLRDARTLWLALCAGWLQIDVRNLGDAPARFDRLAAQIEPDSRFTGLLRVRKGSDLPTEVAALSGKLVGASHPSCGLWPGMRDEVRDLLRRLDHALDERSRGIARQVLRRWKDALAPVIGSPKTAWWRVVQELTQGSDQVDIEMADIRTRGPLQLDVGGERPRALYAFAHEPRRAVKCSQLLAALTEGPRLDSNQVVYRGREIARLVRRTMTDADKRFDPEATIRAGYLDLDFLEADLYSVPERAPSVRELLLEKVGVPAEILARWLESDDEATSPLRPDLTWQRRSLGNRIPREVIDVELPQPGMTPLRLHEVYADAPVINDIMYHPGRKAWVVWLNNAVTNPTGPCHRVSDTTVRIQQGGRTWLAHFPSGSEIAEPQRIFCSDGYRLRSPAGGVLPALPIRRDALDLVECSDDLRPAEMRGSRLWFRFRLFGGLAVDYSLDPGSLLDEDRLHIELWPDLPVRRWRRFWLGVESDEVPAAYEYRVYGRSAHGYYEELAAFGGDGGTGGGARYVSFVGRPRLLWIGTPDKGCGFLAFRDDGQAATVPIEATLAVDFGTFRTALLVALASGQTELPWPASPRGHLPGRRLTLIDNTAKAAGQRQARSLFPPTTGPTPSRSDAAPVVAGVFGSAVVYPEPHVPDASSIPFQDFSLLLQPPGRLRQFPAAHDPIRTGLKWSNDDVTAAVRIGYLKAVLLLGAVEAVARDATALSVRYSFPLAYELREALESSFQQATAWINREVFGCAEGESVMRIQASDSESSAGIVAAEAWEDWIVTLDLGGGTLDLGIYQQGPDLPRRPVAWDSVRLGADLVTTAYLANTRREPTTVRQELLTDTFRYDNEQLIRDTDRLFRLAMEYAARLVAGTLRSQSEPPRGVQLTAVLLGSGWRWDRCRSGSARFDTESFEYKHGKLLELRLGQLAPGVVERVRISTKLLEQDREKLAVAHGLAQRHPEGRRIRDTVNAPNGLDESGRPWSTMVDQKERFGAPRAIAALPAFPGDLDSIAPFNGELQRTDVSQGILTRLHRATHVTEQHRTRTALGIAYEYLTPSWFKR